MTNNQRNDATLSRQWNIFTSFKLGFCIYTKVYCPLPHRTHQPPMIAKTSKWSVCQLPSRLRCVGNLIWLHRQKFCHPFKGKKTQRRNQQTFSWRTKRLPFIFLLNSWKVFGTFKMFSKISDGGYNCRQVAPSPLFADLGPLLQTAASATLMTSWELFLKTDAITSVTFYLISHLGHKHLKSAQNLQEQELFLKTRGRSCTEADAFKHVHCRRHCSHAQPSNNV